MSEDGLNQMRLKDVYVTKEILVNVPNINVDNYGHLRDISFQTKSLSEVDLIIGCLLYTSPSPRDGLLSRMPSSA